MDNADEIGTRFYLVKDGDRLCWLAAVTHSGDPWSAQVYGYVPDLASFVFNGPLTADFQVDRSLAYEPVTAIGAAAMIRAGQVRRLDESGLDDLLALLRAEPRRLNPDA